MDIIINNVRIPDFKKLRFELVNIGIVDNKIAKISTNKLHGKQEFDFKGAIISPGLMDCHCHIESSYLIPSLFGDIVAKCGTLYIVADCHEISNVAGKSGLEFFIENSYSAKNKIFFAVPSCVPATPFATSGGKLDIKDIEYFLHKDEVVALGELMNIPGVLNRDKTIIEMISIAKKLSKRVNGHAPKLSGEVLKKYFYEGIEDDHENESLNEILEKLNLGINIFLREGSAEHTENDAYESINHFPNNVMFCTDDKTINDILEYGHINYNLKKAVKNGINPVLALKVASYNGLIYYGLEKYSEIKEGNIANFVVFNNEKDFNVEAVFVNGKNLEETTNMEITIPFELKNSIKLEKVNDIPKIPERTKHLCIKVNDKSLITDKLIVNKDVPEYDLNNDIVKLAIFERYVFKNRAACRITGFGITKGGIATSLSHDCHNILAVGSSDENIKIVVNKIIEENGGLAVFDENNLYFVNLPVGGIVSTEEPIKLAEKLQKIKEVSKKIATNLTDPISTLTFMALEVIPHLKLTDRGLFDVDRFSFV